MSKKPIETSTEHFEVFDTIQYLVEMSPYDQEAWRRVLLVFACNLSHEMNLSKEHFLRDAADVAEEEWSTPNTQGRRASLRRKRSN